MSVVLAASVLATMAAVARPAVALLTAVGFALFVSPGVLAARAAVGREPGWLSALVLGPIVGFGLSSLALLLFWWVGARGLWILVAAPLLAALTAYPARALRGRLALVTLDRRDLVALCLVLLLVPLVVARPFSRVGAMMHDGKVYRAYFTADYVWRMVVTAELAKGDMPPRNPFYQDDALHYYWLPHLPVGVQYRNARRAATLDELLLCQSVYMDLAFVAFLFAFVRQFVRSRAGTALGITGAVLFTSFEGPFMLWELSIKPAPLGLVRYVNIDAVNRWLFGGMPIDGLQRLLMYQPHHAEGYALGLLGLLVVTRRRSLRDARVILAGGVLLALSLIISTFGALMLTCAVALYELVGAIRRRDLRRLIVHGMAGAVPMAAAYAIVMGLEYTDRSGGPLVAIGVNPVAMARPAESIFLSFGPMLMAGAAGACVAVWRRMSELVAIGAFVAIIIFFYFFVDVLDHQGVYVGWRCGHFMFIALAVFVGLAVQALAGGQPRWRGLGAATLLLLALGAAPTTAIDLFNTQDVENRTWGPGFRWTLLLTHDELGVLGWLRRYTPPDTIVQVDPTARDSDTWAYLPAFAERRMAVGLPISMIPRQKYLTGSDRMHRLFSAKDPRDAYTIAVRDGIDYLLVGPPERQADPGCERVFASAPELFTLEFSAGLVSLFKVNRGAP